MVSAVLGSVSKMVSKECEEEKERFRRICIEQNLVHSSDVHVFERSDFTGLEFNTDQEICHKCFNNTMNEFFSNIVCKITKFCRTNGERSGNFGPFFSYSVFNITNILKKLFDSVVKQENLACRAGHEIHVFLNAIFCFFVVTDPERPLFIELSSNTCLNLVLSAFEATFSFFFTSLLQVGFFL